MYIIKTQINGKMDKNKFCIIFVLINFEEDSKKIINKKAKEQILNLFTLNKGSLFDFNISKSEIAIKKVTYKGFTNLEYNSS